jgi:N-acetylglutamate synthase-like GNAT family acetyltransferase
MVLPTKMEDLKDGEYAAKASEALIQPWEAGRLFKYWDHKVNLQDGGKVSFVEMAMVKGLHDLQAKRDEQGRLTIYDEEEKRYVKFSGRAFKRLTGSQFGRSEDNVTMNPLKFAKEHLKNLLDLGILKDSDFSTLAGSKSAELYGESERKGLSVNKPYVYFSSSDGRGAKYYIGKNKISGLDLPIDYKTMSVKILAPDLAGIVEHQENGQKILATLDLAVGEEMEKVRAKAAHKLRAAGVAVTQTKISQGSYFNKDYSEAHLKNYNITRFLPARLGEKPEDYFNRVRVLDNQEEVSRQLKKFADLGVGVHNLPWGEQLMLCRIALEDKSPEGQLRLQAFAKKYGVTGLRTFISMDYDQSLGKGILNIGEKLEPKLASAIFEKYGEIVNAANQAKEYLIGHFKADSSGQEDVPRKLAENLLKKGKDLLSEFAKNNSEIESVAVMNKLEALKTEVLMFAQAFKVLPKETRLDFKDIAGTTIEDRDSFMLSDEDRGQMLEIFERNRVGNYPENLKVQTLKDFRERIYQAGHTFRVLKHEGKIVAFLHYDQIGKNEIYVGSLNLHPAAKNSPVAAAMLKSALEEKGRENLLKAVVWENNLALTYYSMLGFRKVGEISNYENTGEKYWEMERPATNKKELAKAA